MSEERRRNLMGAASGGGTYGNFGGYMFSNPLVYENGQFRIQKSWNETCSYNVTYGLNEGSTYFGPVQLKQRFGANSDGDINNTTPLYHDGYDWGVPSQDVCKILVGTSKGIQRAGSTVNGTAGIHYTGAKITDVPYGIRDYTTGVLFFPDDSVINGKALNPRVYDGNDNSYGSPTNGTKDTTYGNAVSLTGDELNVYLKQGCIFYPWCGQRSSKFTSFDAYWLYATGTRRTEITYAASYWCFRAYNTSWPFFNGADEYWQTFLCHQI